MITLVLPGPKSARMFCGMVSLALTLGYLAAFAESVVAAEAQRPFASLKADVDLDIEDGEVEVTATFALGPGNNGLNPATEPVTLGVKGGNAAFSIGIPAGSFKKDGSGQFAYQGTINRVRLQASIRPSRAGGFQLEIEGARVDLKGVANPVTVSLAIGDDGGSAVVNAKIE